MLHHSKLQRNSVLAEVGDDGLLRPGTEQGEGGFKALTDVQMDINACKSLDECL